MIMVAENGEVCYYSRSLMDPATGLSYLEPAPHNFSFNSPLGACPHCKGLGYVNIIDRGKIMPDMTLSIKAGGINPLGKYKNVQIFWQIAAICEKYGYTLDACRDFLETGEWRELLNVQICGLMMMASLTEDTSQIRQEMETAANFFDEVKTRYFADCPEFCERSWGMSDDYEIACQCRSTLVRIGTAIFGPRVY